MIKEYHGVDPVERYCEDTKIETVMLDLLKVEAQAMLSGHALESLSLDKYHDYLYQSLVYKLHTLIPAESLKTETHTVTLEYPDGWWNAFKNEYMPDWILRRFPIKYATKTETVTFTAYMLYPKFPEVLRGDIAIQYMMKDVKSGE